MDEIKSQVSNNSNKRVDLSSKNLISIPKKIFKIKNLSELNLSNNKITSIPSEISNLSKLTKLFLYDNQLKTLPAEIGYLKNLQILDVNNNQLIEISKEICKLNNLQILDVANNKLKEIPIEIKNLCNLFMLNLSINNISYLPSDIEKLNKLYKLYISKNDLKSLPAEIGQLSNLEELDLSHNQLTAIPKKIGQLIKLKNLFLNNNKLDSLPSEIGQLFDLIQLDISNNNVKSIPPELGNLLNLYSFNLLNNPHGIPPEVIKQGTSYVINFLKEISTEEKKRYIAKLLLVGEGGVGKTSITRSLFKKKYDPNLKSTHGIDVQQYRITNQKDPNVKITLNVWDFGGQQIYHTTHQFFLTLRSIYILVWNARYGSEQGRLEHWLETIKSLAPDSPIILVATHIDERSPDINYQNLQKRFPQLRANMKVSNKTGEGIKELEEIISNVSVNLPQMGKPWPKSWIDIEEDLKNQNKHHINLEKYISICNKHCVSEDIAKDTLGETFHCLGNILFFKDDPILSNMVVLKPNWITKAISLVLTDKSVQSNKGVLNHNQIPIIWKNYPHELYSPFLRLMERFDLSYQIPFKTGYSLIPQLLTFEPPSLKPIATAQREEERSLNMIYHLNFIPSGIMSWFIVRTHQYTSNQHWRDGVFLQYKSQKALIELNKSAREINLQVWGSQPHNFFVILKESMDFILNRFEGLNIERRIPCICSNYSNENTPCKRHYLYGDLVRRNLKDKNFVECPESLTEVPVRTLLYGIHPATQDQILNEIKKLHKKHDKLIKENRKKYQQMTELLNRNFCRTHNLIIEQKYRCPNVFLIYPKNSSQWNPRKIFSETYVIRLYCQSPHGWHATSWKREFRKQKEWWLEFYPWLSTMVTMIQFAIPVLSTISQVPIPKDALEQFNNNVTKMQEVTEVLSKSANDENYASIEKISKVSIYPNIAVDYSLRLLYQLLDDLDKSHEWGSLTCFNTPDNNLLWLCPEHLKEFRPPEPII